MTLIVPAAATFSIGTNNVQISQPMNMSLDEVIANRRKESVQQSRRGGRTRVSTADRAVAGGRAKRAAVANARRNLTTTKKATKMEIETEVKTQNARNQRAKANQEKTLAGGRVAATAGRTRRVAAKAAGQSPVRLTKTKQAAVQLRQGRPPSKKAVNAAVQAFKANGFQIPEGTQMVIRFEGPATNNNNNAGAAPKANQTGGRGRGRNTPTQNNNNNNNGTNNSRRGGRGGRGRGRGGGRGRAAGAN